MRYAVQQTGSENNPAALHLEGVTAPPVKALSRPAAGAVARIV